MRGAIGLGLSTILFGTTLLAACGGKVSSSSVEPAATTTPGPAPTSTSTAPTSTSSSPQSPPPPPPPPTVDSTATRDGKRLYLSMCAIREAGKPLHIWGEVTDPAFEVDEAIIAFYVSPPTASGKIGCVPVDGVPGVKVLFAEGRGGEFIADPSACDFELFDNGDKSGLARGKVKAKYADLQGKTHDFTVDFVAPACR